jgi:hypothetical protein
MRKFLLFTLGLFSISIFPALAQFPITGTTWDGFSGTSPTGPSTFPNVPANLSPLGSAVTVSQWDRQTLSWNTSTDSYNSTNFTIGGNLAAAQAEGKYLFFTVTNDASTELEITQLHIASQVSAQGPQSVQMLYSVGAGPEQTFGGVLATAHTASPENFDFSGVAHICPGQTATFKLYAWGAISTAGTLRINNNTSMTATWAVGPPIATANNDAELFTLCAGTAVGFYSSVLSGVAPYTYSWSGPGSFSSTDANPVLDPALTTSDGNYNLTVTDAYGCTATATTYANIDPGPDTSIIVSGPLSFCTPGSVTLDAVFDFAYDYTWYDLTSGFPVSGGVSSYTAFTSGSYIVQITDFISGCSAFSDTFNVTATTTPPATISASALSVCSPATITLTTPSGTGYTYQWYSAATGAIAGATNNTYSPSASGTYSVTVINGSCSATSAGTTITINASPVTPVVTPAGPITICSGSPVTLTTTTQTGVTYRWWRGAFAIPGATNTTYGALVSGTYSMVVTGAGGCTATSNGVTITLNPLPSANITASPSVTICTGSSVTLSTTSVATNTYQWLLSNSPIAGATNATYNTTTGGTYRVLVTNTLTGCFDTTTAPGTTLTVQPAPSAADAVISPAGPFVICSSDSVVLSTPGTTPGLTYQWFRPATIAGATNSSYTARVTGTYTVRITNAAGCSVTSAASVSITVNPAPSSTITLSGPATFCQGSSLTITSATGAGYTYQWHDASGPIAGETNNTINITTSGIYYVVITSPAGCQTTTAATTVTVVPTPFITVSGSPSFCAGNSVLLTASTIGIPGVIYQWKRDGVNIPGAVSATYAANVTGTYTCFINIPGSCATLTTASVINVFPVTFPTITFDGTYVKTYNFYASYQWYMNTVLIPGATNYRYAPWQNASYRVLVTDTNGCQILSDDYEIFNLGVDNTAGIKAISVYPNPATDIVHIDAPIAVKVAITTIDGKVLIAAENTKDVNIGSLANGLYMILVYDDKGNRLHTEKLVKN